MQNDDQPNDRAAERTETIMAWLEGSMRPDEAAAFERLMAEEPALAREAEATRRALEATQEWLSSPPPGMERVAALPIPNVPQPVRPRGLFMRRWQVAAAAAVFVIGFFAGQFSAEPVAVDTAGSQGSQIAIQPAVQPMVQPAPEPVEAVPVHATPTPEKVRTAQAEAPKPLYTTDEGGRLRVETTLEQTGARAVWVVDGRFELAQAEQ